MKIHLNGSLSFQSILMISNFTKTSTCCTSCESMGYKTPQATLTLTLWPWTTTFDFDLRYPNYGSHYPDIWVTVGLWPKYASQWLSDRATLYSKCATPFMKEIKVMWLHRTTPRSLYHATRFLFYILYCIVSEKARLVKNFQIFHISVSSARFSEKRSTVKGSKSNSMFNMSVSCRSWLFFILPITSLCLRR